MGPPVGTILGQFGVKIKQFCDEFNSKTKYLPKGVLINTLVYIKKDKTFVIELINIPFNFLLQLSLKNENKINLLDLFKITLINAKFRKTINPKTFLGYLKVNNKTLKDE